MTATDTGGVLRQRALPGVDYAPEELGRGCRQRPEDVLAALAMPRTGRIFDLDAGRWAGMPVLDAHPPFVMTTYRTPRGGRIDGPAGRPDAQGAPTGVMTEFMAASTHTGTHVDALCHITEGEEWYGGGTEAEHLGDHGPVRAEASSIPPFVCRGVLLDIAALRGVGALPAGERVTAGDVRAAAERQGVELRPGDAVLIRTGYMSVWDAGAERRGAHFGAGIDLSAAEALADAGAVLVGADTENVECFPARDAGPFLPVHVRLLARAGVHIAELLYLEQLAEAEASEFLFLCLSLRVRGATGSMVRPVAIV
ncbi:MULTISPECIES: cyclase family protein [Actinomadura]|jgi:kynurenine formamidase|uniref:Cyclase family protein n=1 Tax=Actinomadura geliboluensis TaxID=882440 RepID=A0A5S4G0L8_9ACTN|nr:cyclase family protein [Actinomadura geliboluensis]TMR26508.1 cyclase family protein [Actinomadura geliboluensis]